jgi:trans-2,3-dihydro-3-hydroxyanthranilate isomerase
VPFTLVPLASRVQVDRAEPDTVALRRLESAFETGHPAVFLFSLEPQGGDATVYSRMFAPSMGLIEDPATGGASGPLGCYLAAHQLVPPSQWLEMTSMQGVRMRRPSRVHIRVHGERPDAITRVQVGGQAVKIGRGTIDAAW